MSLFYLPFLAIAMTPTAGETALTGLAHGILPGPRKQSLTLATVQVETSRPVPALQGTTTPESPQEPLASTPGDLSVRRALRQGDFPWYNPDADRVKPIWPPDSAVLKWFGQRIESFFQWLDRRLSRGFGFGLPGLARSADALTTLLFLFSGVVLVLILWRLWRLHESQDANTIEQGGGVGTASRIADLPAGLPLHGTDAWNEAVRSRDVGDRARAVVWLFAYQLLALDRLGLLRLTPGRTARQYVQALHDPLLREGLASTLGIFEEVYYGHRVPSSESFELIWARAEAFRRRLKLLKASR